MCDYFWQRMENSQGDLTDIVRNTSLAGPPETANFSNSLQLLHEPTTAFATPHDTFRDPFADIRDPLLDELAGPSFFCSQETAVIGGGGVAQEMLLREEGKIPGSCLFSRMLQISPATCKALPVIGPPQPLMDPPVDHGGDLQISSPRIQGIKRRKSQAKKVVCIPAPAAASGRPSGEAVPSDLWAWRKYGQKPIKGSPYPRGYYRCSSSKGCLARKQVERSRTDPNMLVITYSSEHNHPWPTQRNALAGSTRSQPSKGNNASTSKCSPPNQNQSTNMIKEESKEYSSSSNQVVKEEELEMEDKPLLDPQDHDFDNVFDESFNEHMMSMESDLQPNDFFADLAELEPEPMNLIFPKGFIGDKLDGERDNNKAMDPFCVFEWGGGN